MKKSVIFLIGLILGCIASQLLRFYIGQDRSSPELQVKTDTIHDTVFYPKPIVRDSVILKYIKIPAPVSPDIQDTVIHVGDSVSVIIPITQKEYKDSTYQAWVSGYNPQLDSIHIFTPVIQKTVYQTIKRNKRWGLGVQVGVGTDCRQITPYLGIGLSYNIFMW